MSEIYKIIFFFQTFCIPLSNTGKNINFYYVYAIRGEVNMYPANTALYVKSVHFAVQNSKKSHIFSMI